MLPSYIGIPINQPGFNGMSQGFFITARLIGGWTLWKLRLMQHSYKPKIVHSSGKFFSHFLRLAGTPCFPLKHDCWRKSLLPWGPTDISFRCPRMQTSSIAGQREVPPTSLASVSFREKNHCLHGHVQQMVDWWFGSRWFGIQIRVPLSNNPFHKGILGIQTTNFSIVDM